MSTVHVKTEIDAPIDRVWETVMDPERFGEWVTIHRSIRHLSAKPLTEGATMDQVMCIRGVTFRVHWTLVTVSAPHRAEWEGRGPAHSSARISYELAGESEGPTAFEYTNEFTAPGGKLGNAASRMFVGAASEREANKSLSRLKALLEQN
ncbi:MAG: SRPBCC family protein [Solirubrobacterales bacterium]|nr:SRPBCC family protein [Solirubrobacterales bacterium]MBV9472690.1 SRPBCC family protein [Solirubrobacterales bacterium]